MLIALSNANTGRPQGAPLQATRPAFNKPVIERILITIHNQ